jgi:osmotically-inducible protein OsmY
MKNQHGRRNYNRNSGQTQGNERGRYAGDEDVNYGGSRADHDQNSSEDYSQEYFKDNHGDNFGANRTRNDWQGGNDGYGVHNRRGENYGFGSQEDNESYRDFSTQGRNSGLGNQGGYSSYGNQNHERTNYNAGYYSGGEARGNWNQGGYNEGNYQHQGPGDLRNRNSNWGKSRSMSPSTYPNYGNLDQADMNEGLRYARRSGVKQEHESQESTGPSRKERSWDTELNSNRGKGPKGYKRSDERIEENINDALTDDDQLDASEIEVRVQNGEVTLTGVVAERDSKRRAEELSESVSGVTNVENRIRVSKDSSKSGSRGSSRESRSDGNATDRSKAKQANGAHA